MKETEQGLQLSEMELKMVYNDICEALEAKKKRDIEALPLGFVGADRAPMDLIKEIIDINARCQAEKNVWNKILHISEMAEEKRKRMGLDIPPYSGRYPWGS